MDGWMDPYHINNNFTLIDWLMLFQTSLIRYTHQNMSTYSMSLFVVLWQSVHTCVLQPRHDKTLGGWAGGTKGEQCQANSSSAGVHSQRQTVETTTGCLPGGGRETTQEGEGWDTGMLVFVCDSFKSNRCDHLEGMVWSEDERMEEKQRGDMHFVTRERKEGVVWRWNTGFCCASHSLWI